jgi:hypothetical protein
VAPAVTVITVAVRRDVAFRHHWMA